MKTGVQMTCNGSSGRLMTFVLAAELLDPRDLAASPFEQLVGLGVIEGDDVEDALDNI